MMVFGPAGWMLNTIVSTSPGSLDSMMACRSEPGPLSFVLVTTMSDWRASPSCRAEAALSVGSFSAPSLVTAVAKLRMRPSVRNRNVNVAVPFAASVGSVQV